MTKEEYIETFGIEAYNEHPSKKGKKLDKYSVCTVQVLKWLWETLDKPLCEDFDITIECKDKEVNGRKYKNLILSKDNEYLCSISYSTFRNEIIIGRENCYYSGPIGSEDYRHGFKIFKTFSVSNRKDYITDFVKDNYLAEIFTLLIDLQNFITVEEPNYKECFG